MAELIRLLREEHANLARLLDVLERQIEISRASGLPDYDIVVGVADYFLDYPDRCHHPKEDLVYRRLLARAPGAASAMPDLELEHREVAVRTRRFAEAVRNILNDVEVPRDAFHQLARNFIDRERRHMMMEEKQFFPLALGALTAADWAELDAQATDEDDPLFGRTVRSQFEALRHDILSWERENLDR